MKQESKELLAGVVILLLFVGVFFLIPKSATDTTKRPFVLYADFAKSDGVMLGADVRVAGIKVGQVSGQKLHSGYRVRMELSFNKPVELSVDSSIAIETDGILGSKYLEIAPGAEDENLKPNDVFIYTQDALLIDELLEKLNSYMHAKDTEETVTEGE